MRFTKLLLYIALAIFGFALLDFVFGIAEWAVDIALIVGLILVILSLVNQYSNERKK